MWVPLSRCHSSPCSHSLQPDLRTTCGINGNYGGYYIHYGIREHAMVAIANGLAAFNRGTIIPITSSFFMFYLVTVFYAFLVQRG